MIFSRYRIIPWRRIESRPAVRAYLAAFDAYVAAGGTDAPPFVRALKGEAFADLRKRSNV